jgi:UDP-glucuronate 4-epimerase
MDFIEAIEKSLGKTAQKNFLPLQQGDVPATWADVEDLTKNLGYKPETDVKVGIERFVKWYLEYYGYK